MDQFAKRPRAGLATVLCSALLAVSSPAHAGAVETFTSALHDGSPTRMLTVWPKKGAVKLFGQKYDYEKATSRSKFDDGVFELLHWPKEGEKGAAAEVTETKQGRVMLYAVKPVGQPGPVCFLRSPKPGVEPLLIECREK